MVSNTVFTLTKKRIIVPPGGLMSDTHTDEVKKHVKIYINVFLALMVLTVVTVAVSYLDLSIPAAIGLALIVATIKSSLVAGFFMHLIHEKQAIIATLILTVVFFLVLIFVPLFTETDKVTY